MSSNEERHLHIQKKMCGNGYGSEATWTNEMRNFWKKLVKRVEMKVKNIVMERVVEEERRMNMQWRRVESGWREGIE